MSHSAQVANDISAEIGKVSQKAGKMYNSSFQVNSSSADLSRLAERRYEKARPFQGVNFNVTVCVILLMTGTKTLKLCTQKRTFTKSVCKTCGKE
ncbi:MAG: hypothetical protein GY874_02825 [Desulfobacteraceae bacterium]|nr:hypothetical protein [Desulfobacteraceae bacterium]